MRERDRGGSMKARSWPVWRPLLLALVVNSPAILVWLPGVGILFFLPFLYWINIPGWFLSDWLGAPHYEVHEFGVSPQTPLAWFLIAAVWTLVAAALAVGAAYVPARSRQFSLRTLLVVVTVIAIHLGTLAYMGR